MDDSLKDVLQQTALDLYQSGLFSEATMRELKLPALPRINPMSAVQIRKLRRRQKVSQAVFAAFLNVSKSTVQQWEQGKKKPNGPSQKLLSMVQAKGLGVLI